MGVLLLLAVVLAVGGRLEASSDVSSRGFMDRLISIKGCGRFAGLVNATANATETFQCSLADGGLVVFCPDDKAVAAFEPSFHHDYGADGQLAILLYHGVAPASLTDRRVLTVPTLATDLANGGYSLTIRHHGDTMELSSSSGAMARVTRKVTLTGQETLVVYLIDAVLLPTKYIVDCDDSSCPLWAEAVAQGVADIFKVIAALAVFIAVIWLGADIYRTVLLSRRAP